jgi:hypothetical protein
LKPAPLREELPIVGHRNPTAERHQWEGNPWQVEQRHVLEYDHGLPADAMECVGVERDALDRNSQSDTPLGQVAADWQLKTPGFTVVTHASPLSTSPAEPL